MTFGLRPGGCKGAGGFSWGGTAPMQRQIHREGQCGVLLILLGSGRSEVGMPFGAGCGHGHGHAEGEGHGAEEKNNNK